MACADTGAVEVRFEVDNLRRCEAVDNPAKLDYCRWGVDLPADALFDLVGLGSVLPERRIEIALHKSK